MLGLCLGFTACDGFDEPNPEPQTNPQEALLTASDVQVATVLSSGSAIDLSTYNTNNEGIPVLRVDTIANMPSGYEPTFVAQLSKDESYSSPVEVETTVTDGLVTIAPDAWEAAHKTLYGKSPKAQTTYVRLAGYVSTAKTSIRLVGPDTYYGAANYVVTPLPSELVIEDNYYLLGTINGWDVATALPFTHSDASPYDDPVFTIILADLPASYASEGMWWKIVPESVYVTGAWGSGVDSQFGVAENGDDALEGLLIGSTADEDPGAGCVYISGNWKLTINMEEGTYAFTEADPYLYVIGNPAWSFDSAALLATKDYVTYEGYANLDGEFKFTNAPDWSHTNYGNSGEEGKLTTDGSAGNLEASAGFYYCEVVPSALTYKVVEVTTIGLIGGFNGWEGSVAMTSSEDNMVWTLTDVALSAGDEVKFRANDGWDVNLGGTFDELWQGGDNLVIAEDGTYDVTLYIGAPSYCEFYKK
ncbi:MAG: hypothetical protein LIO90_05385 [Bacteroidales bacterium]|nr:hypothetical protein [Bacteroidales bacterium]